MASKVNTSGRKKKGHESLYDPIVEHKKAVRQSSGGGCLALLITVVALHLLFQMINETAASGRPTEGMFWKIVVISFVAIYGIYATTYGKVEKDEKDD